MILIALCGLLVGAVLGTRYRVLVLVPAVMLGLATVMIGATMKGSSVSSAALAAITWGTSLQLGYLCGLFTRYVMVATRTTPIRSLRSKAART